MINTVKKKISPITNELCSYRVTLVNSNLTLYVPLDPANKDYQAIQEWVAEGNTIEEAD
tara:strand:- start:131 stop:307 length:177 start_codon:yes stop_codon:yes gene_type:complete